MLVALKKNKCLFNISIHLVLFFFYSNRKVFVYFIDFQKELGGLVFGTYMKSGSRNSEIINNKIKVFRESILYLGENDVVYNPVDEYMKYLNVSRGLSSNYSSFSKYTSLKKLRPLLNKNFSLFKTNYLKGKKKTNVHYLDKSDLIYNKKLISENEIKRIFKNYKSKDSIIDFCSYFNKHINKKLSSVFYSSLFSCNSEIYTQFNKKKKKEIIIDKRKSKEKIKLNFSQIVLVCKEDKKTNIYVKDNLDPSIIECREKLKILKTKLNSEFFFTTKSYIINLLYIHKITKTKIYFSTLDIPVSKNSINVKLSERKVLSLKNHIKKLSRNDVLIYVWTYEKIPFFSKQKYTK